MSEIRSQAAPARDSGLTDALRDAVGDNYDHGRNPNLTGQLWHEDGIRDSIDWAGAARDLERDGWSKPRTVNSATELDALPMFTVIRSEQGSAWERQYGALGKPLWIEATQTRGFPHTSDEITLPATVLFTPGDAG
ncbi:UNVERIFIED_ORG: hypothetical protein M2328_005755 [Rhodococcus erythropolis]